jgi:hypothetical protein
MKKLLVALMLVAFAATSVYAAKVFTYETKMGNVTFDHDLHKGMGCKNCHHEGAGMKSCKECHDGEKAISAKDAYHKNCIECHKAEEQGPTGCKECHVK